MRKMAQEMDVEFDEEEHTKPNKNSAKFKVQNKKAELKHLLSQPMLPFGVSRKYLTGGVITDLVDRLIENNKGKMNAPKKWMIKLGILFLLITHARFSYIS